MKWNPSNINYYQNLGYQYTEIGDSFSIKIEHLNKNSHYKVLVSCDCCDKISLKEYKSYNTCLKNKTIDYITIVMSFILLPLNISIFRKTFYD